MPQVPQKPRSMPGDVSQVAISPFVTSKFSDFAAHQVAKAAPIAFWQERQWQCAAQSG